MIDFNLIIYYIKEYMRRNYFYRAYEKDLIIIIIYYYLTLRARARRGREPRAVFWGGGGRGGRGSQI